MALQPMYAAVNNSPQTTTAEGISAAATEIPVVSVAGLPPAPNLVTLGTGEDAELIRYNSITGGALTGCERGFNGTTPRTWEADTLLYRAFTAYDHDAFRVNIEGLHAGKAEANQGLPAGGGAGQVLIKQSGTDYDVTWGNGGGGSDASITAYTVTLAAGGWAEREGGGYEQAVPIATATALDTCEITAKPRDGLKAWAYDLWPTAQGPGTVTFGALYLPAEDMVYDLTVVNADRVQVDAVAQHNADPAAHPHINIDGNDWGEA